eukprot:6031427-Ditylum_brightwellii.AAC.1
MNSTLTCVGGAVGNRNNSRENTDNPNLPSAVSSSMMHNATGYKGAFLDLSDVFLEESPEMKSSRNKLGNAVAIEKNRG